jgi:hypothetical protein
MKKHSRRRHLLTVFNQKLLENLNVKVFKVPTFANGLLIKIIRKSQ